MVHRTQRLASDEVTLRQSLPLTAPARTLVDLADVLSARELERALAEAMARRLLRQGELERSLSRAAGRRGSGVLRAVLQAQKGPAMTRSEAEERLLSLVRGARLPAPHVNAKAAGLEVDFLWREQRLVVEVDGYAFHSSPGAFERDRMRTQQLQAAGLRVSRITWRQLADEPEAVVVRLALALASTD